LPSNYKARAQSSRWGWGKNPYISLLYDLKYKDQVLIRHISILTFLELESLFVLCHTLFTHIPLPTGFIFPLNENLIPILEV
jgi:hypothetical protein